MRQRVATDRIAGALGKPNTHEQKASAASFVVCRFIARSLLVDLPPIELTPSDMRCLGGQPAPG
ncbi:hypothetical protein ACFV2D_38015, partial [Streptomyces capillispiralis]